MGHLNQFLRVKGFCFIAVVVLFSCLCNAAERTPKSLANPYLSGFAREYFTTEDKVRLAYYHKGVGKPLILLHGWSGSAKDFSFNADEFSKKYSVYILELRGHGYSETPAYGARVARLSKDLDEFIAFLGVDKVSALGYSMGSSVLWSYVSLFGEDKIEKFIFVDQSPALMANPTDSEREVITYGGNQVDSWDLTNAIAENWGEGVVKFAKYFTRGERHNNDTAIKELAKIPEPNKSNTFLAQILRDHLYQDWRDVIPRITVPVLIVSGDISHISTVESNEWVHRSLEKSTWIRFSKDEYGTHFLHHNSSKKFNREVIKFLGK